MKNYLLKNEFDIQLIRGLIARFSGPSTLADFEESIQLVPVRATTRLWEHNGQMIAYANLDTFNNLRFEIDQEYRSPQLENEIVAWGIGCIKRRNAETDEENTLDASCAGADTGQINMLERSGFVRESVRTLAYARSLMEPIAIRTFPQGFSFRYVKGEQEVERLVALHRAAVGTQNMTVEARLAIMRAPNYERTLDLVALAPDGELSAFCICGFEDETGHTGYTDPIGTHLRYRRLGLGKALVTAGLLALKNRGARVAKLGTSSENIAMQQLAKVLGFVLVSERLWYSKKVT
jgi:ribosomal protein S18 acetylase RimI-like enzyme